MSAHLDLAASANVPWEAPLPLGRIDTALQPLRRVLAFAMRDLGRHAGQIRYFEANTARGLAAVPAAELPPAIGEGLAAISAALAGFDALDAPAKATRLRSLYQDVARLDALLGLPLAPGTPADDGFGGVSPDSPLEAPTEESDPSQPGAADAAAPEADEADTIDTDRRVRLGDPVFTGRPLAQAGVDPAVIAALAEDGVETVSDLLLLAPTGEEVVRPVHGAGRDLPLGRVAVGGRVMRRVTTVGAAGRRSEIVVHGAGDLRVVWPEGAPLAFLERFPPGARVSFVGEAVDVDGERLLRDAEPVSHEGHAVHLAKYAVEGVDDRAIRLLIWRFLPELDRVRDPFDASLRARLGLCGLAEAVADAHLRGSARPEARKRLAFDEALLLQLGLASARFLTARERGIAHTIVHGLAARAAQALEITLGDAQTLALEDIKRDLREQAPMLRVLTGEPGAGKAFVAFLAAIIVAESKSQVLFLAPDATSADFRHLFAEPLLRELGFVARLVVGEPTKAQRDAIRRGEVHIVFGSPDLLDRALEFRRLGLVVAEEREHYGRAPAKVSAFRAPRPDLLVLGVTPVPTAVLLSAYGDHDLSVVDGRRTVAASILPDDRRGEAYAQAREAVAQGRQVFVVFPLAPHLTDAGVDVLDLRDAHRVVEALAAEMLPGARVALFHGAMAREERARVYDDFVHHRLDVLVATTHVEDGPPVPAATLAIVEQADRMSLTRLLRLRSHLATEATCLFVTGEAPDTRGLERLASIVGDGRPLDSWALADADLEARGLETMIHRESAGTARLRWLEPGVDRDLMLLAREQAHAMLADDPSLRRGPHGDIGRALRERWDDLLATPCPLPDGASPAGGAAAANKKRRRRRKRR
jgi:ATP-dependent DNA helicase RecG